MVSFESTDGPIVIAGGSGFLGISLATDLLTRGASVVILSRHEPKVQGQWRWQHWDARSLGEWQAVLDGAAGLVNLTGRSVDCRKTPDHLDEILRSRVESTRVLGQALRTVSQPPPVWVQMSTAHIYGDPPSAVCTEQSAFGYGMAPIVGRAWEAEYASAALPTQRQVILRTSFVVGRDRGAGGGAMSRLGWATRLGLGGTIGSGTQGMSWIHEHDMNQLFVRGLTDDSMQGAYIASAPHPESQRDFARLLRKAMGVPIGLPATDWMVRCGCRLLLNTDPELALYGRYVIPRRLIEDDFEFQFPRLADALADLYGNTEPAG